jgi:hypothetical protein
VLKHEVDDFRDMSDATDYVLAHGNRELSLEHKEALTSRGSTAYEAALLRGLLPLLPELNQLQQANPRG